MKLCTSLLLGVVATTFSGPALSAQFTVVSARDSAQIAGWYVLAPHHDVLVVWGPTGGYRLLDFDGAHFHRLERTGTDRYRVAGSGPWENGSIAFARDRDGRTTALTMTVPDSAPRRLARATEYAFDIEEVRFSSGGTELAGLLMIPRVRKLVGKTGRRLHEVPLPLPGAVFIHGSGESDRDNVWAFTFAQSVARAGFVTLLPDKRGSGASGGDWKTTDLAGLGADALAGVALLRADPRVDAARVGLIGLSQGGVVAPLAAARSKDVAFVVSVSAGAVPLFTQMRHELHQDLTRAGLPPAGIDVVTAVAESALAYARSLADSSWSSYAAARDTLASGPYAAAAEQLPASRDDWHWSWWHQVGDVDPLPAWHALDRPALAIFGEQDEQDNVPVAESVRRLQTALQPERNPRDAIRVFPGIGHTLVDPGRGWVSREVLSYVSNWLLKTVGGLDPTMAVR